ncbi:helix-turn-helix domain-containing protein [Christensenella minuta]|uniref:ISPsy9, transposase OrfA family protein n=1 Tax=Christensenella minuta TaxID=626937 RepID=A0A136Q8J3_9FIRM|nr:helix-turn-helix domain-containing protein [Christensenella minuta]AYH41380.1 transposase [Christensenella minuta]KXK67005.1 ISPsy9, transposase OrfA family protein [Christensenella minuta]
MGKKKYSLEEKVSIVEKVLSGEWGIKEAGRNTGIHKGDIQKWIAAYEQHGVAGLDRRGSSYTGEFKQTVIEDMRINRLSLRETAAKYNIAIHSTISRWERIYLEEGAQGLYAERRGRRIKGRPPKLTKQAEEDLIAENQRLRAEVDYLKKLNALVQEKERQERKPR